MQTVNRRPQLPAEEEIDEDRTLPPRSLIHPSEKGKWTRYFYQTLLILFILLIVAIIGLYFWNGRSASKV